MKKNETDNKEKPPESPSVAHPPAIVPFIPIKATENEKRFVGQMLFTMICEQVDHHMARGRELSVTTSLVDMKTCNPIGMLGLSFPEMLCANAAKFIDPIEYGWLLASRKDSRISVDDDAEYDFWTFDSLADTYDPVFVEVGRLLWERWKEWV